MSKEDVFMSGLLVATMASGYVIGKITEGLVKEVVKMVKEKKGEKK